MGPDIGDAGNDLALGVRYTFKHLPTTRKFDEQLQVGFEFKSSNNNLVFGGFQVSNTTTEVDQFYVEYDATERDDYGQTDFTNSFVVSPGGLTGLNNDRIFALQTCGGPCAGAPQANYFYDHIVLTRLTGLPQGQPLADSLGWFGGVTSITKVIAQLSDGNLLPSEQLGAGGIESVRGYDERVANGAEGVIFSQEFRTPAFSLAKTFDGSTSAWNDLTQLGVFWDYGSVFDHGSAAQGVHPTELDSVGLGFHLLAGPDQNIRVDLDYGWGLRRLPGVPDYSQFGHVSVTIAN